MKIKLLLSTALVLTMFCTGGAKIYKVASPNGNLSISFDVEPAGITYSAAWQDSVLIAPSGIALQLLDGTTLGPNAKVVSAKQSSHSETISAPYYRQSSFVSEYNSLLLQMKGNWALEARAYNDGVAYRFVSTMKGDSLKVKNEIAEFNFLRDYPILANYSGRRDYIANFEKQYEAGPVSSFSNHNGSLSYLPLLVDFGPGVGKGVLLESDVENYPGMFINQKKDQLGFTAQFPPYPAEHRVEGNGVRRVSKYSDFIAKGPATRTFPWRILAFAHEDTELPVNNMVYALASPNRIGDTQWIKPGRSTWDWWNNTGISGVDFKVGFNNDTYRYYIDFAAEYGFQYVLIDDGWYDYSRHNVMDARNDIDIPALCQYAKTKDIRILLWVVGDAFDVQAEELCEHYSKVGVAGFKLDFFERQDQQVIDQTIRMAKTAAKHNMLLNLHGIYVPKGLHRTYPNIINYEGVFGLEQLKWTDKTDADMPRNDVLIPFMRQLTGPLDYTQGATLNRDRYNFRSVDHYPMSQGTRAHQVATYICFDSPLAMLCDSPTRYIREAETTRFINSIPSVFSSTFVPQCDFEKYVVIARQQDGRFYIGALNNWDARTITLPLDFLPAGNHKARIFRDGINSDRIAEDYLIENKEVTSQSTLTLPLASGGGCAIIIE